ncbi:MAG: alpha/beta hydrolase [Anaerolineaceae bacterium]
MNIEDQIVSDNFYHSVDTFIKLLGAERVSDTDLFFRISRAAIGTNIDYSEIKRIIKNIKGFYSWYDAWAESANRFLLIAEKAEEDGHLATAGENYLRVALLYHFAQLFTRPEDNRRIDGQAKRVRYYKKACPYQDPIIEPVTIPFDVIKMPGYLRYPSRKMDSYPVVLMVPGANSVKEELHNWAYEFTKRGLVTLTFDGPGQGEISLMNGGVPLSLENFPTAVSAAIDFIATHPNLDTKKLVVWGQSTGGQLAMRAAAQDNRIKAVVSLGGGYDFRLEITSTTPADVWEEARDLYGLSSFKEAEPYIRKFGSMKGIINNVTCPLLIIHGALDNIVAIDEIEQLKNECSGPVDIFTYDDGNHSVCNRNLEMRSKMADWVLDHVEKNNN